MKTRILALVLAASFVFACNQKKEEANQSGADQTATTTDQNADTTSASATEEDTQLYSCSMHPEVVGKKGEQCSKCGMDLTEPVKR